LTGRRGNSLFPPEPSSPRKIRLFCVPRRDSAILSATCALSQLPFPTPSFRTRRQARLLILPRNSASRIVRPFPLVFELFTYFLRLCSAISLLLPLSSFVCCAPFHDVLDSLLSPPLVAAQLLNLRLGGGDLFPPPFKIQNRVGDPATGLFLLSARIRAFAGPFFFWGRS